MPLSDWINFNTSEATGGYNTGGAVTEDDLQKLRATYDYSTAANTIGELTPFEQYQQYQRSLQPGNVSTIQAMRSGENQSVYVNPAVAGVIGPTNISATGQASSGLPANIFAGPVPLTGIYGAAGNAIYNLASSGLNYVGNLGANQVALGGLPEGNVRIETGYNPTYPNYLQNVSLVNAAGNPSGIPFNPSMWSPAGPETSAKDFMGGLGLGEGTAFPAPSGTVPSNVGAAVSTLGTDAGVATVDPMRVSGYRLGGPMSLGDVSSLNQVPALFDTSGLNKGVPSVGPVPLSTVAVTTSNLTSQATSTFSTSSNTSTATATRTENVFNPNLGVTTTSTPVTSANTAINTSTFATTSNTRTATGADNVFNPNLGVTTTSTPLTSANTGINTSTFGTTSNTRTTTGTENVFNPNLGVTATATPLTSVNTNVNTTTFGTSLNTSTTTASVLPTYTVSDTRFTTGTTSNPTYSTGLTNTRVTDTTTRSTGTAGTTGTTTSNTSSASTFTSTFSTYTGDTATARQTTSSGGTTTTTIGMPTDRNFERELGSSLDTLSGKQQSLLDYYNKIYQQFMPETLTQAADTSLGQMQADAARLARIQSGYLSPEDTRNAVQAAREAYAARGQLMGQGAVGAEILGRENIRQQRENEARAAYNASMQNVLNTANLQTGNVFQPVSSLIANTFNPLGQYPQDVYNTNFNAAVAQAIAEANNKAAIEAAKQGASAQQNAAYISALGKIFGNTDFSKIDWSKWF